MTNESMYHLQDVQKRHDSHFTLHIPQLEIKRGEVMALLGPTGAGKSTLLRLLAGVEKVMGGKIHFDSSPFTSPQIPLSIRRRVSMVHQHPILLTGTVRMNVEYGLRLRKVRNRTQKVDEMLKQLRLSDIASREATTLSGGQTQLVALARSLVIEPKVLLLDEPTAHLDPAYVELIEATVLRFQQEQQSVILWATHNLFQARRVADRSMLLLNGQLVEVAPTEEFFTNPRETRTDDFVNGRMVY